ncbi:MAG: hypothetical protein AB7V00_05030 [Bacilli bacterium]
MKIKQDYVSPGYHQIYFSFSSLEIQNIYEEVISSYQLGNVKNKKTLKQIDELVMKHIENKVIDEEIEKLDVFPVSWKKYRYLNEVSVNQGLVVICQFCVLPPGTEIQLPSKIPSDILKVSLDRDIFDDFTNQLMIKNNLYEEQKQQVITDGCLITYDISYEKDDFTINHIENRQLSYTTTNQKQFKLFLDKHIGDEVILDIDDEVVVKAKITEITKKVFPELTDDIVTNCHFLNTKTVEELTQKVTDIYQFSTIVILLIDFLAEFVMQNGDLVFDETIINHYWDYQEIPKGIKAQANFKRELTKSIIKEYIIAVINLNYPNDDVLLKEKIHEEYEFDKILFMGFNSIEKYQIYMHRHLMETKVLQYCLDQGIVELPK